MKALPTLRQMQYLIALHETQNFGRAADLCFVTQPTLSVAIKEMEVLLGLPVLDRSRRKTVTFTPFGLEVVKTARQIMPQLERMMDKAGQMAKPLSGPMRLGLIPTMAPYLLPLILPNLQKEFPNIDFQIIEGMSATLIERLHGGKIDIALMAFPYETDHLHHRVFYKEAFHCAAPKGLYKKDQKLSLADLDAQKLLLLEDGHCLRDHALSACKLQNIDERKTLSATSLLTLIQMVSQGYGITLLPEMVLGHGILPKDVTLHSFKSPVPTRQIGAAWRQKDPQEGNIEAVLKKIKKILIK